MGGPKHIAGSKDPVVTSRGEVQSDKNSASVEISGVYAELKAVLRSKDYDQYCPDGFTVGNATLQATGDGMGVLRLSCSAYGDGDILTLPEKTTFSVDMAEVQKDLQCHPKIIAVDIRKDQVLKWLATEEKWRYNPTEPEGEKFK